MVKKITFLDKIVDYVIDEPLRWWTLRPIPEKLLNQLNEKLFSEGHKGIQKVIRPIKEVLDFQNLDNIKDKSLVDDHIYVLAEWNYVFYDVMSYFFFERPTKASPHLLPSPIDEEEIQRYIRTLRGAIDYDLEEDENFSIDLEVGDKIKIKKGSFEGQEGEVVRVTGTYARVAMHILGRKTDVDVPLSHLQVL